MFFKGVSAPIVGTTSLKNLQDLLGTSAWCLTYRMDSDKALIGALDVKLTDEEVKLLEEPYQPQKVFGHF